MNEQLEKIWDRAREEVEINSKSWKIVDVREKFAELIVRECVAAVLDLEMESSGFVASVIEGRLGYEQQSLWNEDDE